MGFFDFFRPWPPKRDESLFLELCASGTAEQVEEAIRNGASVYARYPMWDYKLGYPSTEQFGKQLFTPLLMAAKYNRNDDVLEVLIRHGADVNARDNLGYTALMYAAAYTVENGIFEPVAEPLIRAGADVNARDNEGQTALTKALELGCNRELIATLKKFGAE